jgi:hypothetical protein
VLALLQSSGTWQEVPQTTRDYATGIVLAAETRLLAENLTGSAAAT